MDTLRYPTLQAWADAVCDAVRVKEGTTGLIDHQDVPDRILAISTGSDTSGVTAKPENVSEAVRFLDSDGVLQYGTMPEVTDAVVTLDGDTTTHTIEEGHHTGGGSVRIVPETSNRFTPAKEEQEYTPSAGKVYTKVILDPIPDIYKDVSGATMVPAYALAGYTFFGKAGELEEGEIVQKTGKQGATVTTNANRYIPAGYHDGTSYITVNVPQEITTIEGEDSTNCTAEASDVRYGKSFRSGGSQKTGSLRTVSVPTVVVDVDTETSASYVQIEGYTNASSTEGILPAGSSGATVLRTIPKYTGDTSFLVTTGSKSIALAGKYCENNIILAGAPSYSGSYSVTPGDSAQTLPTSGCYMNSDITVNAAAETGGIASANLLSSMNSTIPFTFITEMPDQFVLSLRDSSVSENGLICELVYNSSTGYVVLSYATKYTVNSSVSVYTIGRSRYTNGSGQWNLVVENGFLMLKKDGDWVPVLYFDGSYDVIWR